MDHPCDQCGQRVEDGKAFCAHCGAPQIRVVMPENASVSTVVASADSAVLSGSPSLPSILGNSGFPAGIVWSKAIWACVIAALVCIAVISVRLVPPLLALPGAGVLAVILWRRRNPAGHVSARVGGQLGAATGFLCSAVFAFFLGIFIFVMQSGGEARRQLIEALQQFAARSNDPQIQASLDLLVKPENMVKLIWGMVGLVIISIAACSAAGALTGAYLARRKRL